MKMKTNSTFPGVFVFVASFFVLYSSSGQGSLTPPGAPGATMLTLSQIEPRTPISSAPYTITNPGSYYLTTNLTVGAGQNGIVIATNGVALDLNGFTLSSTAPIPNSTAILFDSGLTDVKVFDGQIKSFVTNSGTTYSGTGFGYGIYYLGVAPANVLVSQLTISGVYFQGIYLGAGASTVAKSCIVNVSGGYGIVAGAVSDCTALNCDNTAVDGYTVENCYGVSQGGLGIDAQNALNCYGASGTDIGISASTVANCYGYSGSNTGISATTVENCYSVGNGSADGIDGFIVENCYGYSAGGDGINADATQNCYAETDGGPAGINTQTAQNCAGYSDASGDGIDANYTAIGCYGTSHSGRGISAADAAFCTAYRLGGTAIQATVATGCYAAAGTNIIVNKYNMP
jgi:hypothetical protein